MAEEEKTTNAKKGESATVAYARGLADGASQSHFHARATLMYTTKEGYDGFSEVVTLKHSTKLLEELEANVKAAGGKARSVHPTPAAAPGVPHCENHPDRPMKPFSDAQRKRFNSKGWYCSYSWQDEFNERRYCDYKLDQNLKPLAGGG